VINRMITKEMNSVEEIKTLLESAEDMPSKVKILIENRIHLFSLNKNRNRNAKNYFELIRSLAELCPATALSISMHLFTVWGLDYLLNDEQKHMFLNTIDKDNVLFGSINEAGIYFTNPDQVNLSDASLIARKVEGGYQVNGRKKFVSLEPFVRFIPVYCFVENYNGHQHGIVCLIIDKQSDQVTSIPDWNSVSMLDSCSNTVEVNNLFVSDSNVVRFEEDCIKETEIFGYLFRLSIASVYYGIANKALDHTLNKSVERKVPHTKKKLASFPGVQFSVSEMIILLETSYSQLMRYCEMIDQYLSGDNSVSGQMKTVSLVTKDYITTSAEKVVDLAMKIEGISSITGNSVLSALFKDVKAGMFHPPQKDITYELIAKDKLGIISYKNRWL
jgi:alkylation response protein AidB-like acyl-CoA dehydrogenase